MCDLEIIQDPLCCVAPGVSCVCTSVRCLTRRDLPADPRAPAWRILTVKVADGLVGHLFFPDKLKSGVVVPVFLPCGNSAPDMTLCLVHLQNATDTAVKLRVDILQTVGHVFMYGRFRYMKLLGGGANRRVVFNNILTKFNGSFFNGSFHVYHPLQLLATILCAASFEYA